MSEAQTAAARGAQPGLLQRLGVVALWVGGFLAVAGALIVASGPVLYRAGVLDLVTATAGVQRWALLAMAGGLALAALGLVAGLAARRQKLVIVAVALLVASGSAAGKLYGDTVLRAELPPINDVQTDWDNPVAFSVGTLRTREAANAAPVRDDTRIEAGSIKWAGRSYGEAQAEVYELTSMVLPIPPGDAIVAAAEAARRLGWAVMYSDPPAGQMEATHHSFWYGLASDIAVRATPAQTADGRAGARIDVRATSREPGADMGANAQRVKAILDEINFATRSASGG